jgi:hypothetical protein
MIVDTKRYPQGTRKHDFKIDIEVKIDYDQ